MAGIQESACDIWLPPSVAGQAVVRSNDPFGGRFCLFTCNANYIQLESTTSEMIKNIPTSIRLSPEMKAAAKKLAKLQHRSLSNLVELLLMEACEKHGIKIDNAST